MRKNLESARRWLSFSLRRRLRGLQNSMNRSHFATAKSTQNLPHLIKEHRLPIYRRLSGVDPELFENKRRNLELAIAKLDGLLVSPGKVFSLWRLVGPPTSARGYLEGLVLDRGRPSRGVGGGLCQLANALLWLALHAELRVVERHHHSLDIFPDDHRRVPFGTGASIVYNFKDLRFKNDSRCRYQFRLHLTDEDLVARIFSASPPERHYFISESDHAFISEADGLYRRNTILREVRDAAGNRLHTETLFKNFAKCQYTLQEAQ
ncbi:MAG: VanW family protein [Deltaproteobacteria bacterium]|nr:VanW family protein [Deltaproteobacteria bacterium]